MENLFNLRAEKQEHIINAGFTVFGRNGYKKASIADIANEAGTTKGMIMYYFGSKKNLYVFLIDLCVKMILEDVGKGLDERITDYFDKIKTACEIKIGLMKKYPAIISFLTNVYYENDAEVSENIAQFKSNGYYNRKKLLLKDTDMTKFKDDVDPDLLDRFFVWASKGLSDSMSKNGDVRMIDVFLKDFYDILDLMKRHFYKA